MSPICIHVFGGINKIRVPVRGATTNNWRGNRLTHPARDVRRPPELRAQTRHLLCTRYCGSKTYVCMEYLKLRGQAPAEQKDNRVCP